MAATVYVVVTRLDVKMIAVSADLRCVVIEVSCVVVARLVPSWTVRRAITVPLACRLIDVTTVSTNLRTNQPTNQSAKVSTAVMSAAMISAAMSTVTMLGLCLAAKSECECGRQSKQPERSFSCVT